MSGSDINVASVLGGEAFTRPLYALLSSVSKVSSEVIVYVLYLSVRTSEAEQRTEGEWRDVKPGEVAGTVTIKGIVHSLFKK